MSVTVLWPDGENPARRCSWIPAATRDAIATRVLRVGLERVDELTLLVFPYLRDEHCVAWHSFPEGESFRSLMLQRLPGELLSCMLGLHEDTVQQDAPLVLAAMVGPYLAFDEDAVRDALTRFFEEVYRGLRVIETASDHQHDASLKDAVRRPRS